MIGKFCLFIGYGNRIRLIMRLRSHDRLIVSAMTDTTEPFTIIYTTGRTEKVSNYYERITFAPVYISLGQ